MSPDINTAQRSGGASNYKPLAHISGQKHVEDLQRCHRELINHETKNHSSALRKVVPASRQTLCSVDCFNVPALPSHAHASFLHGETLDTVAGAIAWFAFILVPPVLIGAFLLVHILPEKVAEKRHHPQLGAIKCLCLLSLCFGGLLWPIAWLWAYTKPVLHKMAYGTDVDDSHGKTGRKNIRHD